MYMPPKNEQSKPVERFGFADFRSCDDTLSLKDKHIERLVYTHILEEDTKKKHSRKIT